MTEKNTTNPVDAEKTAKYREDSITAASDNAVQQEVEDLVDSTTREICKYVCTVAGTDFLATPDNSIKCMLVELIVACEARKEADES